MFLDTRTRRERQASGPEVERADRTLLGGEQFEWLTGELDARDPEDRSVDGHGYLLVDVTSERVQADWQYVDRVRRPSEACGRGDPGWCYGAATSGRRRPVRSMRPATTGRARRAEVAGPQPAPVISAAALRMISTASSMRSRWVRWLTTQARMSIRLPTVVLERNTRRESLMRSSS